MTKSKTLATSLLSLSAAALLAICAPGGATAAPAAPQDNGASQVSSQSVDSGGGASYWTPERMRAAIPGDVLAAKALARGTGSPASAVEKGSPAKVAGKSGKGKTVLHTDENPVSHIGKVFFTMGGSNYVCSGNSVTSTNKSTVSTAGHCVNEGPGAFATNFVFVPAYLDGAAPYGKWAAKALYAPTQWSSAGDMQYDTGFAVVSPLNGQSLADVVGSSGVQFNAARGLTYTSYGYPAAAPFDGQSLVGCTGPASDDPYNPQFNSQGIPCDMTGGSSGGPWFIGSGSAGYQNSINSYGYSGAPSKVMYGPYWGSVIEQAYTSAASAS
ncbi:trypsin-like serine peptidase [Arthrobacter sp. 92]|jgi:V8-like Glu-specific endopeptidase|uniref:trypsin-like serine peptidase n=1 Tax=Arthrobacter sp. 92 TaxID=3418175 RepID=UPI003D04865A